MPKNCLVPNCNKKIDEEVLYHQFPNNVQLKHTWLLAIGRPDYKPTPTSLVCSKHFEETDYTYRFGNKILRNSVVPSIFNAEKIRCDEEAQKPQPKEKNQEAVLKKHTFYVPHYILVNRQFLNPDGSLDLNTDNLSAPILYGIGNTRSVINSPDAVTFPFLKRKTKEDLPQRNDDSQNKSRAIKELTEIHSYNKRPEGASNRSLLRRRENVEDEVIEIQDEEEEVSIVQEDESSPNISQKPRKVRDPSRVAWKVIERTLSTQKRKIQSLQTEYDMLQNQHLQLEMKIKEMTEAEN